MWNFLGPTTLDRASPKELAKDKVWSWLNRMLQLSNKESLERKPGPLHATELSNLVRSPPLIS